MTYEEKFIMEFDKWVIENKVLYPPCMDVNQLMLENFEKRFRKTHDPPKK